MRRILAVAAAACITLAGCAAPTELADDARSAIDDARERVDDVRSRVDDARGQLDELARRADEIGQRLTWCGAAVRLGTAVASRDVDAAAVAAEDLRGSAPAALRGEVTTVAEAAARAQVGDAQVLLDPEVQEAARVVLAEARDSCGVGGG